MEKENIMKFNEKDFKILACSQPGEVGYINDDRALELMKLKFIKQNPKENWWRNGYKATDKGIKLYNKWLKNIRKSHGHEWILNEYDGKPNCMAYCEGYHNGFKCKKCGFEFCHNCYGEWEIPKCSKENRKKKMSDDNKLDSKFISMDKSIRNSYGLN